MKAAEVLRLYEAGRRDFKGVSLRGQNFKGKDLSGADFSGADIRGTNFANANLTGTNFTQSEAGLQKRWVLGLLIVLLLLSVVSGFFSAVVGYLVSLIFDFDNLNNQAAGWVGLAFSFIFLLLLLRKGIGAGAVAAAAAAAAVVAVAGVITAAAALTLAVAVAVAIAAVLAAAVTGALATAGAAAIAGSMAVAMAVVVALATAVIASIIGAQAATITAAAAITVTLVSAYVGWRALRRPTGDAWIRSVAIAFAAMNGTNFHGATLTDADFSQACLESTDFRRAILRRTCWQDTDKLDYIRSGETYLNNPKIRELVRTGNGQGQSYDHLSNLEGINLQGANLVKADFTDSNLSYGALKGANLANTSFIGANLNCVYLQDADLSNAKLVQTQLDAADLTGSTLTGACIEDWGITTRTKLHGISCDYVFMHLLSDRRPDQNPHRKPDDWKKTFEEGEFVDFIAPMVQTLDLYHNQTVDPRAVAIAYHDLQQKYPEADLEIVSMEKRGKNRDKLLLRAESSPQANLSKLNNQYFERYNHLLTLPSEALKALLIEKDKQIKMLARMVDTAIERPSQTFVNQYNNKGDITVSEQGSNNPKYDLSNAQFAGGFAETVHGNQVGGTINNQAVETLSLAEAAAEIQILLKQLEASNPTATEADQTAFLNVMIPPTKRERFVGALKSGSSAAIDEIPYGPVLKALVEGWHRPNG